MLQYRSWRKTDRKRSDVSSQLLLFLTSSSLIFFSTRHPSFLYKKVTRAFPEKSRENFLVLARDVFRSGAGIIYFSRQNKKVYAPRFQG